jgi:saccharopine dehydrogenase-like NADP-dependent oxidoreductase
VVEEYTRPARYLVDGRVVIKPALSDPHLVDLPGVGTLEAFNTDGLRTLLEGMKTPSIREFTLRYPGHIELMRVFREVGLFSKEGIVVPSNHDHDGKPGGVARVCPLDVTAKLLFPMWSFEKGEQDLTVMRIVIDGMQDGQRLRRTYDLLDHARDGVMSMSRTTGYTATGVVRAVTRGMLTKAGIYAPEQIGAQGGCYEFVLEHLRERGIEFSFREERMGPHLP